MCHACAIAKLNKSGMEACNRGEFAHAEQLLQVALDRALGMNAPLYQAKILNNLALVHQSSGQRDAAIYCLRKAVALANAHARTPERFVGRIQARIDSLTASA
ncbi:MAG: tetratricopeptide repeat protein [Desulfovibrionaceae bacterium]|jgi:tetratricopeptide (TPR) repeat protein|nr:tetratricopeptide repeat protein [Desulfovibrionaceae bacterium]